jgi:pyrophosphatase PpaX
MRYAAVIFDMDGTLTDNLDHAARAYRQSFARYTGRTWTNEELFALFGPNCEGICRAAVPDRWEEALEMFYRILDETYDADEARVPGIEELLDGLKARGVRLGIVSGGSRRSLEISLKHVGLGDYFEKIVGGSVHGAHKAESIREVLDAFGVAPQAAAYVGDSTYDVGAARAAGVLAVRAAWGKSASLFDESAGGPGPDKTFRNVSEFTAWVASWS